MSPGGLSPSAQWRAVRPLRLLQVNGQRPLTPPYTPLHCVHSRPRLLLLPHEPPLTSPFPLTPPCTACTPGLDSFSFRTSRPAPKGQACVNAFANCTQACYIPLPATAPCLLQPLVCYSPLHRAKPSPTARRPASAPSHHLHPLNLHRPCTQTSFNARCAESNAATNASDGVPWAVGTMVWCAEKGQ